MSPKNNHDPTSSGDTGNANVQEEDLQEMEDVNRSLDALSCALDVVEQRTDDIMSQVRELLNSNREIRRMIEQEKGSGVSNSEEEQDDNMEGGEPSKENASK